MNKKLLDDIDVAAAFVLYPHECIELFRLAATEIRRLNTVETNLRAEIERLRAKVK